MYFPNYLQDFLCKLYENKDVHDFLLITTICCKFYALNWSLIHIFLLLIPAHMHNEHELWPSNQTKKTHK